MADLRSRPPRLSPDDFISGAESPRPPTGSAPAASEPAAGSRSRARKRPESSARQGQGRAERPWEQPGVRADVTKVFNLRLPEPLKLKLDFIRQTTRISAHEFIMSVLVPAVEAEIERLENDTK